MDEEALRLAGIPGVSDRLLAALALTSPTLIQLQLLRSLEAVEFFVRHARDPDPRAYLDDEHRCAITLLYQRCAPRQPVFQWLPPPGGGTGFRAEYRLDEASGIGEGTTKREAKGRAAAALQCLLATDHHVNNGGDSGGRPPLGDR